METSQNPEQSSSSKLPQGKEQRRLKNYLIDARFQVKYAFFGAVVTFALCVLLAIIVLWQSSAARKTFVDQRKRATELVQKQRSKTTALVESMRQDTLKDLEKVMRTASEMVSIHLKSKDLAVREAAKAAKEMLEKDDKDRIEREKKATAALMAQRRNADKKLVTKLQEQDKEWLKQYGQQQNILVMVVLVFGLLVVVVIFLFNIRFTHRAAGPLYKIRQYLISMREGRLGRVGKLRKDDQLQDFHEQFRAMHEALVEQTEVDIETLETALAVFQQHGISDPAVDQLRKRLATKRASLLDEREVID